VTAHRAEHLELCAGWALGCLDEADREAIEAHLAGACPECESELEALQGGVRRLAACVGPVAPPAALRPRTLAAAAAEPRDAAETSPPGRGRAILRGPRPRVSYAPWAWAAAAAVLAVAGFFAFRSAERLRNELAVTRVALENSAREAAEARRWAALLESPTARTVLMTPTPQGLAILRARALYDPGSRRAVIVFENIAAPAGTDYQLWALRGAGVASLGLVHADAAGRAIVRLEDAGDPATLAGFAVSLERAGGSSKSDAPEGPVVLAGKFGG
jgi:anti-sigma-K factor RskA